MAKTFLTCAITGNMTRPEQSPHLPITPEEIADSASGGGGGGRRRRAYSCPRTATGRPSMEPEYYRDVMDRIRARNRDLIINLTTGPGGRFVPLEHVPKVAGPGTALIVGKARRASRAVAPISAR